MIECATEKDYAAIAALNVSAYVEFSNRLAPGAWDSMQQNLGNIAHRAKSAQFFLHRADDTLAGSVAYCPPGKSDQTIFDADMAAVLLLAVDPAQRGKCIARALMAVCIDKAKKDNAKSIALFTNELMQSAQKLYSSLGFRQDKELSMRYGVRYFRFSLMLL
jgi:ribosomal protein S18 acetylase RimI-like enzyme